MGCLQAIAPTFITRSQRGLGSFGIGPTVLSGPPALCGTGRDPVGLDQRHCPGSRRGEGPRSWGRQVLGFAFALALSPFGLAPAPLQAQQPIRPLPRNGACPLGYYGSGDYCVPSDNPSTRGAIEKSGNGCPLGFYGSGNYCLSSPSNDREAIPKQGNSCPLGWFGSGSYCVKSR